MIDVPHVHCRNRQSGLPFAFKPSIHTMPFCAIHHGAVAVSFSRPLPKTWLLPSQLPKLEHGHEVLLQRSRLRRFGCTVANGRAQSLCFAARLGLDAAPLMGSAMCSFHTRSGP